MIAQAAFLPPVFSGLEEVLIRAQELRIFQYLVGDDPVDLVLAQQRGDLLRAVESGGGVEGVSLAVVLDVVSADDVLRGPGLHPLHDVVTDRHAMIPIGQNAVADDPVESGFLLHQNAGTVAVDQIVLDSVLLHEIQYHAVAGVGGDDVLLDSVVMRHADEKNAGRCMTGDVGHALRHDVGMWYVGRRVQPAVEVDETLVGTEGRLLPLAGVVHHIVQNGALVAVPGKGDAIMPVAGDPAVRDGIAERGRAFLHDA